jgi:hypothetical protein
MRERKVATAHKADELAYGAERQHRCAGAGTAECLRCRRRRTDSLGVFPNRHLCRAEHRTRKSMSPRSSPHGMTPPSCSQRSRRDGTGRPCLVQRRAAIQTRLRDGHLSYATPTDVRASSHLDAARFVADRMEDLSELPTQGETFMLTPAFAEVFGRWGDEGSADADGIPHVALRLMDYHLRFPVGRASPRLFRRRRATRAFCPICRVISSMATRYAAGA